MTTVRAKLSCESLDVRVLPDATNPLAPDSAEYMAMMMGAASQPSAPPAPYPLYGPAPVTGDPATPPAAGSSDYLAMMMATGTSGGTGGTPSSGDSGAGSPGTMPTMPPTPQPTSGDGGPVPGSPPDPYAMMYAAADPAAPPTVPPTNPGPSAEPPQMATPPAMPQPGQPAPPPANPGPPPAPPVNPAPPATVLIPPPHADAAPLPNVVQTPDLPAIDQPASTGPLRAATPEEVDKINELRQAIANWQNAQMSNSSAMMQKVSNTRTPLAMSINSMASGLNTFQNQLISLQTALVSTTDPNLQKMITLWITDCKAGIAKQDPVYLKLVKQLDEFDKAEILPMYYEDYRLRLKIQEAEYSVNVIKNCYEQGGPPNSMMAPDRVFTDNLYRGMPIVNPYQK